MHICSLYKFIWKRVSDWDCLVPLYETNIFKINLILDINTGNVDCLL